MASEFVDYAKTVCRVKYERYKNGQTAIRLTNLVTGEPVVMATVAVDGQPLAKDQVVIKDYGENKGVMKALTDVGVIKPTGERINLGYEYGHICTLRENEPLF